MSDLQPIIEVRKWQTRDGSLHDSADQASTHTLLVEIKTALSVHNRNPTDVDRSARHLLSHFNVARQGERLPMPIPPTTEPPRIKTRSPISLFVFLAFGFVVGFVCRGGI